MSEDDVVERYKSRLQEVKENSDIDEVNVKLEINYRELEEWLACPECGSPKARIEKGSLSLYCGNCQHREQLTRSDEG